jgi:hypothetical protein
MEQVTTFSIFNFSGWNNKIFALKSMSNFVSLCSNVKGLEFMKLMGTGSKDGFSVVPNFGRYTLLCVWENEKDAIDYFSHSLFFRDYVLHTTSYQTIYMKATMAHGLWGGTAPFVAYPAWHDETNKVAVITRATIRWKDMFRFWREVPAVSRSLQNGHQPIFAAGVGELPFRYQATFSIWEESGAMKNFAYQNKAHLDMVSKTRKVGWYSEELFARFYPYHSEGTELVKI